MPFRTAGLGMPTYGKNFMSVRVYRLTSHELQLTDQTGPTLDAVSLRLPNGAYTTLRT